MLAQLLESLTAPVTLHHLSSQEQREYLINMGLSLDGCDDVVTLRGRVAEAEAAALQTRSLSKAPSNPVKLASGQGASA